MSYNSSSKRKKPSDLLGSLLARGIASLSQGDIKSVVDFAEKVLFNGAINLYSSQRAILKAFYNEPLEEEERAFLKEWKEGEEFEGERFSRSTYVEGRQYRDLVLEAGRAGSKSALGSIICLYEFYKLINLDSPAIFYGLLPSDPIAIFVAAQGYSQVSETIFSKITGYTEQSFYFKGLKENRFIEVLEDRVRCREKNVEILAKHSNMDALRGYNLKLCLIDEAAFFPTNELGENKALYFWEAVGKGTGRFGMEGRKVAISSACKEGDPMETLYSYAERDPNILGFRLRTWDINKGEQYQRFHPSIVSEYNQNPEKARLEYEGIRRSAAGGLINKTYLNLNKKLISILDFIVRERDINEKQFLTEIDILRLERDKETPCFIHIDYGTKKDAAALALSYPIKDNNDYKIGVGALLQWLPYRDKNGNLREVSYSNIEDILMKLVDQRNVIKVTFDQFQSTAIQQKLALKGIQSEIMSSTREKQRIYYTTLATLNNQNLIILPSDSPLCPTAIAELSELIILDNGKIIHPTNKKDLADAVTLSVFNTLQYLNIYGLMHPTSILKPKSTNSSLSLKEYSLKRTSARSTKNKRNLKDLKKEGLL